MTRVKDGKVYATLTKWSKVPAWAFKARELVLVGSLGNQKGHIHAGTPGGTLEQMADGLERRLGEIVEDVDVVDGD